MHVRKDGSKDVGRNKHCSRARRGGDPFGSVVQLEQQQLELGTLRALMNYRGVRKGGGENDNDGDRREGGGGGSEASMFI